MKVAGFTFIRNAIKYDYPIREAIMSIMPLCDEVFVAVGNSEDETRALIQNLHKTKITIIDTTWDDSLRSGGKVLALETDKAFQAISKEYDWAFYIQGDEVLHNEDLEKVRIQMQLYKDDLNVDGLLFDYLHFYGSYDYIGTASSWYKHEVRVIRPAMGIYSYKDAQGFRKGENEKLYVKKTGARIFHYGYVKDPRAMQRKQEDFNKYWHDDNWIFENIISADEFDYSAIDSLRKFEGTHPLLMNDRIAKQNWKFDFDISTSRKSVKDKIKDLAEKHLGLDWNYKNYRIK